MLKITVLEEPEVVAIKLEGRLGGPWTTELAPNMEDAGYFA